MEKRTQTRKERASEKREKREEREKRESPFSDVAACHVEKL
jgi:hypothetical protein